MDAVWNRVEDGFTGNGRSEIEAEDEVKVLVSTYTSFDVLAHLPKGTEGAGIYSFTLDARRRELRSNGTVNAQANPNPAFMRAAGSCLYVVNERIDQNGVIHAYRMGPSGSLELINTLDAAGKSTCYVHKDRLSQYAIIVNYWDATVSVAAVGHDGSLREITDVHRRPGFEYCVQYSPDRPEHLARRQGWSHTHCVIPSPDDKYFFVPDLGEDKIHQFVLDRSRGKLTYVSAVELAVGHGPRHFIFHPKGSAAYVVNELDSTVDVLSYEDKGDNECALQVVQTVSTIPPGLKQKSHCAEIKVGPSGRFLYVANRFSDSIAIFSIDVDNTCKLKMVSIQSAFGCTPRHFSFYKDVMIVTNTDNDSLVLFEVDEKTGLLKYTGNRYNVPAPNYVLILPAIRS